MLVTILDRILLFVLCIFTYINGGFLTELSILYILILLIFICLHIKYNNTICYVFTCVLFSLLCFFVPPLISFFPIFTYESIQQYLQGKKLLTLLPFVLLLFSFVFLPFHSFMLLVLFCLISIYLCIRTFRLTKLKEFLISSQDATKEKILNLELKYKRLVQQEESNLEITKLNERNSIARDIHDNVGHLLSRSIIQVGAIRTLYEKDTTLLPMLNNLDTSLHQAMDSIRKSVHKLYAESTDIISDFEEILSEFKNMDIDFQCEDSFTTLALPIKTAFTFILKEALNNVCKHSNATKVSVSLKRFPVFIQFIIQDNGSITSPISESGIGLKSIKNRIQSLHGYVSFSNDAGFKIFINIPIESEK